MIFCLDDIFWCRWGVKAHHYYWVTVDFSFQCYIICLIVLRWYYVECVDIYNCYSFFSDWSLDQDVSSFFTSYNSLYFKFDFFSYMSIATLVLFSIPFAWNTFFHALNFSLYVSLDLNYIFCRRENAWIFWVSFLFDFVLILYWYCFCIHSASLCLLVGAFNTFTLKVITNMHVLIALLFIVLIFLDLYFYFFVVLLWFDVCL